jgi:hypothetical protein
VEHIKVEDLKSFVLEKVKVSVHDTTGEEQAPFVSKTIQKLELCPDNTHLRIYFDHLHFLAVPLTSKISMKTSEWSAYDLQTGLQYVIRKERDFHD